MTRNYVELSGGNGCGNKIRRIERGGESLMGGFAQCIMYTCVKMSLCNRTV